MNALSNGITIEVESTGKKFHTIDDWGFGLGNNNYIGDPEPETSYISIPGRNGMIDLSEALTGKTTYKKRPLSFSLGGIRNRIAWDSVISELRNDINGRICKIIFDNDQTYFWRGRVYINGFDRMRELGEFTLSIPQADPYKYNMQASNEPWLWDPFNFRTGIVTKSSAVEVNGTATYKAPAGYMEVSPEFICSVKSGDSLTVSDGKHTVKLKNGTVYDPRIKVNGDKDVTLTFTGKGSVEVAYRGGSL